MEGKNDGIGGDNWSYNSCKAPVKIVTTNKPTLNLLQSVTNQQCQSTEGKLRRINSNTV